MSATTDQFDDLRINDSRTTDIAEDILGMLTTRERRIAELVAEGLSNKEISRQLNVREGTVKVHLHHIYAKLSIANRTSLAVIAARYEMTRGPVLEAW
jgi:two-component system, NarL family, nitrate/nitrite response regulator NarL